MLTICLCGRTHQKNERCECKKHQAKTNYEIKKQAYNDRKWKRYSKEFRSLFVLCAHCERINRTTSIHPVDAPGMGCVDHIYPFRDKFDTLFWDIENHQGLCWHHHDQKTKQEVAGCYSIEKIEEDIKQRQEQLKGIGGQYSGKP